MTGSPGGASSPSALLASRVERAGATPLLTFYDDASGERTELSALSLSNSVAKLAALFVDDLDVAFGEHVAVRLPAHWQTAAVLLGLWRVGAVADLDGAASRVQVVAEDRLDEPEVGAADEVLALSLRPLAAPLARPRPGIHDYAEAVPPQPDVFPGPMPAASAPVLVLDSIEHTAAELVVAAQGMGLPRAVRLLAAGDWSCLDGLLAGLVSPLALDGSVVLVRHPGPDQRDRAYSERVTARWGLQD